VAEKPKLTLETPIQYVKGVGPKMAKKLARLNIETVGDLINHFPFRHQDFSLISPIGQVQEGETVTLIGQIKKASSSYTRSSRQKTIQRAILEDDTGSIEIVWFNQPYLTKTLAPQTIISASGKIRRRGRKLQLIAPDFEIIGQGKTVSRYQIGEEVTTDTGRLTPVYPTIFGITSKYLRRLVARVLPQVKDQIEEFLPKKILVQKKLIPQKEAIIKIHFPENEIALEKARKRLAFNEMFLLQLQLLSTKKQWQKKQPAPIIKTDNKLLKRFVDRLPFALTRAQNRVIGEILADLEKSVAMNRLLQGDVGSGKTVVAAAAILMTASSGYQSALMVPTEILAQQHYQNLSKLLEPFGVKTTLLTSSTVRKNPQPATRNPQLIIGTHALIHKYAQFDRVGLVVIDEQHRFGVSQRAKLIQKAQLTNKDQLSPHILTMTATPIPRTITLTIYGDLDVSILDEMPPGRKPVKTYLVPPSKREACYQWVKKQITNHQIQAFIICPFIEPSETLESVKAATAEYQRLQKEIFPNLRLGLLHGKMKSKEKEEILLKMSRGELDILVATPVVEVGIDIASANIMIIEAADRFGLAQLHQLRGRVGRGKEQAYCFLFADKLGKKAKARLKAMEEINDGMKLAEIDLQIRGPGEVYGTRQHGFPEFRLASLTDLDLIQQTRSTAENLLSLDPELKNSPKLKQLLDSRLDKTQIAPN